MIRSQMISFRPESAEQRNLFRYIILIEEVFAMIKENSSQNFCVNSIASSIRQVVLKNDCLESKNDLLDFFFLCEKAINQQLTNSSKKNSKNWVKVIQSKINQIKGLQALCIKFKTIKLKRGFDGLSKNNTKHENSEFSIDVDAASIEVEEDIKLKTLYFFKWCKFIEYGKSIKKLRLKEIDDLRKSLTFNMYAVKFSFFHNWRRQARLNASNREKFDQIQRKAQITIFINTVNSFYSLFEIKKIEEKLVGKVQELIKNCKKQWVFKRLAENKAKQMLKANQDIVQLKLRQFRKSSTEKIKYRFLYYLTSISQLQPIKTRTLTSNFEKSNSTFSLLCAKTALQSLKRQFYVTKSNFNKIQEMRKSVVISARFTEFKNDKNFSSNCEALFKMVTETKVKKFMNVLRLNSDFKRQLEEKMNVSFDAQLSIQSCKYITEENFEATQSFKDSTKNEDLFKYLQFIKLKEKLSDRLQFLQKENFVLTFRKLQMMRQETQRKLLRTVLVREMSIFGALNRNHQRKIFRNIRNGSLAKIYQKNLLKTILYAMKKYKFIRLSHEQTLENIQLIIINPKQLLTGFNRIYERNCKIQACEIILGQVNKFITRTVFGKCFSSHIQTLQKAKEMEKQAELKKLDVLFTLLKKNQEYNQSKIQEIRQNVISKLNKAYFIRNLKSNRDHAQKYVSLFYFNLEQRQSQFINSLNQRKEKILDHSEKFEKVEKMLGLSLLRKKVVQSAERCCQMEKKCEHLSKHLRQSEFDLFVKALNTVKNSATELDNKFIQLQTKTLKCKFNELIYKINYEKIHAKPVIGLKVQKIYKAINYKSFLDKFSFQTKNSYIKRWADWKKKEIAFEKMETNKLFRKNIGNLQNALSKCKVSFGWAIIKENLQKERQVIDAKISELIQFLGRARKRDIKTVSQKVKSIKEAEENTAYLIKALKLKYLSKLMRNSLIIKYEKVKEFCAIRSYARNLKMKTFNGFRIMLMRLRDKENRFKTEQEIIIKIDKALYNSRKSNQLSETIQRFNSMKRSLTIGGPR